METATIANDVAGDYPTLRVGRLPKSAGQAWLITPEWAAWALEKYNTHNRRRIAAVAARIANEIRRGQFQLTHQGIAFSKPPEFLVDGQHRLLAIAECGVAVPLRIFTDQDPESQIVVDDHRPRSDADAFTLTGLATTSTEVAIANAIHRGPSANTFKLSKTDLRNFMHKHLDAIRFALGSVSGKKKGMTAATLAVIARAYYLVDNREKLVKFMQTVVTGFPQEDDCNAATPIALRNYLMNSGMTGGGGNARMEIYRKTQRSLKAYLDDEILTKAIMSDKDLFPLQD